MADTPTPILGRNASPTVSTNLTRRRYSDRMSDAGPVTVVIGAELLCQFNFTRVYLVAVVSKISPVCVPRTKLSLVLVYSASRLKGNLVPVQNF